MHVTFLGARLPLTKTFLLNQGVLSATPYPHVTRVTSFHEQASTLQQFHDLMREHADQGHCLFGGQLSTPLVNESRAGKTLKTKREWVVFDFDKVEGKDHADVVARYLPQQCQNVSYIAQLSASMFRPDVETWSGHIFMLLKEPTEEMLIKQWVEHINFNTPALASQLHLSDSQQALHWPLDRTAVYNSKLIYIAPPKCHGFEPAIKESIKLVKKKQPHMQVPAFTPVDTIAIRQKINELRRNIGLDDIDYSTASFEGHEILLKSGPCEVSGMRTSGDHYLRFNLNGGDSYAYFIDLRNPAVIRNFKGEPYLKTEDVAPDLFKSLRAKAPGIVAKPALDEGTEVLAFYATNQSSAVKVGSYNPIERRLTLNSASETSAKAWLSEWGLVQKGYLPHMELGFDPTSDVQYIAGTTRLNTFRASDYMARARTTDAPSTLHDLPPVFSKTVRSMLGNPDDKLLTHFVNWLAFVFQTRRKTQTAWVLNGRTGTGKSMFNKAFLAPLFGPENVRTLQFNVVAKDFNGYLEDALFVVFEEADTKAVENSSDLMSKLKHFITDSPIEIRKMRTDVYSAPNYTNFILNTNERTPAVISGDDRRFNFGERQEQQLFYNPNELATLADGSELNDVADVLQRWPVNAQAVTQVIDTQARKDAHEASTTINQLVAEAISRGDLDFFLQRIPSDAEAAADFHNRFNPIGAFKQQIEKYTEAALSGTELILMEEDLFALFRTLIPDPRFFQDSKTWRKRHYKSLGLDVDKQHRDPNDYGKRVRGVRVLWNKPTDLPEAAAKPKTEKVVNFRKGRK